MKYSPLSLSLFVLMIPDTSLAAMFQNFQVEMQDGVHLNTNTYYPEDGLPVATILIRSTYGADFVPMAAADQICDGMRYAMVVQDTRGRYGSEGVDDVFLSDGWAENQDGYDTIEWITQQPWSNGKVGMFGASALGITAYLAAGSLHPALLSAHVGISASDFYNHAAYQGGVFREGLVVDWLEGQGSAYMLDLYKEHPMYDATWEQLDLRTRYDQITTSMFHWGGWYDIFAEGPGAAFHALQKGGEEGKAGPQQLLMGPWTHTDNGAWSLSQGELTYPSNSIIPLGYANPFTWFDRTLKGERVIRDGDQYPVRYYVMGDVDNPRSEGNYWAHATEWPMASTSRKLYLREEGKLSWDMASDLPAPEDFVYDPADPSPSLGGRELSLPAGPHDQISLLSRADILEFTTGPLERAVKVVGNVRAQLYVSSSAPDTDFSVRLVDIYPDGRWMLVTDGILKTRYRQGYDHESFLPVDQVGYLDIDVGTTAIVFDKGHQIGVLVSSSNTTRFKAGNNSDGPIWSDEPGEPAINSIYVDNIFASALILPEPERGAFHRIPDEALPDTRALPSARRQVTRGVPLTPAQYDALSADLGAWLLQTVAELPNR